MNRILGIAVLSLAMVPVAGFAFEGDFGSEAMVVTPARVDVEVGVGAGENGRVRNRRFACYAENRRGRVFRAIGQNANRVQRRAMNQCFRYSYQCRPLGCQRIR